MRRRCGVVDGLRAVQSEACVTALQPVQRRAPLAGLHPVPAERQPQFGTPVAAVGDEGAHVAAADRPRGQLEIAQQQIVARRLVVEMELAVAADVVAQRDDAGRHAEPLQRRRLRRRPSRRRWQRRIGRPRGVAGQRMLDVGEQQLLVLLLVVHPEPQQRVEFGTGGTAGDQHRHALVDLPAPSAHVIQRRARDEAALCARMLRTNALVVAVEEHAEGRVERGEARFVAFQQKGLEEPGGVRQMPLARAGVGHRLQLAILCRQRRDQRFGPRTYRGIGRGEVGAAGRRRGGHGVGQRCIHGAATVVQGPAVVSAARESP